MLDKIEEKNMKKFLYTKLLPISKCSIIKQRGWPTCCDSIKKVKS